MQHELAGQVAIVTGGSRGIGRAIAQALAAAGAAVCVTARSEAQLAETVALIESSGGRALALPADVTDRLAIERLVEETERSLGAIDLLVNNAAAFLTIGPAWTVDADDWWREQEVNVRGPFLCMQAVLRRMAPRRHGRVINVASISALAPRRYTSGYAASKAALVRLTDTAAIEAKEHSISIFAIHPGMVHTELAARFWNTDEGTRWLPALPAIYGEHQAPAERAATLCVFLASGQADILTGRFLDIDDDVADLVQRAEEIERDDLYALRLRKAPVRDSGRPS